MYFKSLFFCLVIIFSNHLPAQDHRIVKFDALVKEFSDSLNFNGVLSVSDSQGLVYNKAIGYARFETRDALKVQTKFRIASLSKMIISYMVFILADQGKLKLDEPIGNIVPDLKPTFQHQLTFRFLLDHTSGLARDLDKLSAKRSDSYFSRAEIIQLINSSSLQSVAGAAYSYSNIGYSLLGIIIEKLTDQTLNEAFQQLLAQPLKLTSSGHEETAGFIKDLAFGYDMLLEKGYPAAFEDKSHVFAAGSFYSNAPDLIKFGREVINGTLLSDSMHTLYLKTVGNNRTAGAWITYTYRSELPGTQKKGKFLTFSGSCPGYNSFIGIFLDHKIVVVGLSNSAPINTALLRNKFGNIAVGLEKENVIRPAYLNLLPSICEGKLEDAVKLYDSIRMHDKDNQVQVSELNQMGYIFLSHKRTEEAIHIFRFASRIFPDNANVWDSLGESLLQNGEVKEALMMYFKSLQLNPNNGGARKIIERYRNQ